MILDTEDGEIEAQVLFTCHLEETGLDYVIYIAPNPETGKKEVTASKYSEADELNGNIEPVETDEEWEILDEYLNAFVEENDLDLDELLK